MTASTDRRSFLQTASLGLGGLALLDQLPPVSADDSKVDPKLVRLDSGIEPLVRLLEETPRDKLIEEVAAKVKAGLSYQDVLAALFLAGVRNIQPRPSVGFKFHAVLVVNSAHLASVAGPAKERWLPIFWALDQFKSGQAATTRESGWRMPPVNETDVPSPRKAKAAFVEAMTAWDEAKADVAAAGLARSATPAQAFDLFARYGCRDFRDIGHKIIYVSNAFRTLEVIGWQYSEPVLRSLAYALLRREGKGAPSPDTPADKVGFRNAELARKLPPEWAGGKHDSAATADLLAALRQGSDADLGEKTVALLNKGVGPQSVWGAVFLGAGELLMRQPGIVGLHTLTTANALRYAYGAVGDEETRKLLMLQAISFLPMFRGAMTGRGKVADMPIDKLEAPDELPEPKLDEVFATLSKDKLAAARQALAYLRPDPARAKALTDAGRLLTFLKGTDSHDYKYSSAVLEDYAHVSPHCRNLFLAASLFWLKGSAGPDAAVVGRIRTALS